MRHLMTKKVECVLYICELLTARWLVLQSSSVARSLALTLLWLQIARGHNMKVTPPSGFMSIRLRAISSHSRAVIRAAAFNLTGSSKPAQGSNFAHNCFRIAGLCIAHISRLNKKRRLQPSRNELLPPFFGVNTRHSSKKAFNFTNEPHPVLSGFV